MPLGAIQYNSERVVLPLILWTYGMRAKQASRHGGMTAKKVLWKSVHCHLHFMEINGEALEIVSEFIFLGSEITVDGDYSPEIKKCLPVGRKAMTNPESVL